MSLPLAPLFQWAGIAAGMEARDDDDLMRRFSKIQSVRKSAKPRRSQITVCDRKLFAVLAYARDLPVDLRAKPETQPLAAGFVPIKCVIDFKPRQRCQ